MSRAARDVRSGLVALALVLLGCRSEPTPLVPPQHAPRNVLLVVVDTLRRDHLECYGYERETAPRLCGLAAAGARCDGISPTAWTKPAVATLLTGLHPLRHQAIGRQDRLPAAATTLAEKLREHGFTTLAVSASSWINTRFGFDQGFEELVEVPVPGPYEPPRARHVNRLLLPRLEALRPPFFLYIHYIDPHDPYDPELAWDGSPSRHTERGEAVLRASAVAAPGLDPDSELVRHAIDLYDGEIRTVDTEIGRLLDRLKELGLLERTLTVVTSDHGEEFQEHGRAGHGHSLHREVTHVPLLFHAPGAIAPRPESRLADLADVTPTVLELLGLHDDAGRVAAPEDAPLAAWLARATAVATDPRDASGIDRLLHLDLDGQAALAATKGQRKLLLSSSPRSRRLFDIARDEAEQHDLLADARSLPADAPDLAAGLAQRYNELTAGALPSEPIAESVETESLRALGYIDGGGRPDPGRILPTSIRPADLRAPGLLGWEPLSAFRSCVEPAAPQAAPQLLGGWFYQPGGDGRFTLTEAALVLTVPEQEPGARGDTLHLELRGRQPERFVLDLTADGQPLAQRVVGPGSWHLELPVDTPPTDRPYLVLGVASRRPAPAPGADDNGFGVFVQSACLSWPNLPPSPPGRGQGEGRQGSLRQPSSQTQE